MKVESLEELLYEPAIDIIENYKDELVELLETGSVGIISNNKRFVISTNVEEINGQPD